MPSKKQNLPLHVSLHRIEEERRNVALRTNKRIAQLYSIENSNVDHERQCKADTKDLNCCLNVFCFCLTLVICNLLFLQWLYLKVSLNKL
jgi:hypothetical protein